MTEAEWLACDNPNVLWEHCDRRATERKKMLLRVAFCRHALTVTNQAEQYEFEVSVLEGCADGQLDGAVRARVFQYLSWPARETQRRDPTIGDPPALWMEEAMIAATAPGGRATESTLAFAQGAIKASGVGGPAPRPFLAFIRDIFGNPFRPLGVGRACGDGAVVCLAQAAYDERVLPSGHIDNARLAVLSDALEEAGCTDDAVLTHLRSSGPHVRGCWALDLILGKN
jgi:hypothetical protein